jgi:16S rRNA processing protein RimM
MLSGSTSHHQSRNSSGSPAGGEPEFLVVGKLGRPHGIWGEISMEVLTDFPERIVPEANFYVGSRQSPLQLQSCRPHKRGLLVKFEGFTLREQVAVLSNQLVQVRRDDRPPLPDGEYYLHQLLGLRVIDEENQQLGIVTDILSTGANDVYVIRSDDGVEILLPAIDSVILKIDLDTKQVHVHLLPGLLPDQ